MAGWTLTELPRHNRAVLFDGAPPSAMTDELAGEILPGLPAPENLPAPEAKRLLVLLGFVGASVARHRQERDPAFREDPERAFDGVRVGPAQTPFRQYFAGLAERTGTGHYHRDSYASLVRWNVGTTYVRWREETLAVLPGAFDDGAVRTYAGAVGEVRFFELVKKGEAVELAINGMLQPLSDGTVEFDSVDGISRAVAATALLDALRQLFREFVALPDDEGMTPEYFMDVFRQFAVHWSRDDIPPSGALDPEALKRDFLLGISLPGYASHVRRIFPALLAAERVALEGLAGRPPLPVMLLRALDIVPAGGPADASAVPETKEILAGLPVAHLRDLMVRHPALGVWYRLLVAHARASGAHLQLSKRFLFKPQAQRDSTGIGDAELVSNRRGTTGMDESLLERLTRARKDHVLSCLRVPAGETAEPTDPPADSSALVRIGER